MGVHIHGREWLLSTLFDASLLSTFEPPETVAPFFVPFWVNCDANGPCTLSLSGNYVGRYARPPSGQNGASRAMLDPRVRVTALSG